MDEKVKRLIDLSIQYRGNILHHCILLEDTITDYLAMYFVDTLERYKDIREVVLDRLTFDNKIATLDELIKRNYPDSYKNKYPKLFSELRYIKDVRNSVAHWPVYSHYKEGAKIPKEFSLINFRNGVGKKVFSKGEFELFQKRTLKCIDVIKKIGKE
ncbi:hypothetical protein [Mucilaginibacter panaciglaebae]|uniref:pEK499-p136 HEPN domain-containing protein n=1 Tax=Mucilaginibacter panaciglaebae TaxID=502331 RepID=A0ABP7WYR1_9SPHI